MPEAVAELNALPPRAQERDVASRDLLRLRQALGSKPNRSIEEEAYIVSTQDPVEKLLKQGRGEGQLIQARAALRRVLAVRKLDPSPAEQAQIDACAHLATLNRWLGQALLAQSAAEALQERATRSAQGRRPKTARSS